MTIQHPEFAQEQQYVEHAYGLLDRGLAEAEQNIVNFEALHRSTAHAMNRALAILQNSRGSGPARLRADGSRRREAIHRAPAGL
jgi:hypothetical protein